MSDSGLEIEQAKRIQALYSAAQAFEAMRQKYELPLEDDPIGHPDLTIDDMGEKSKIWETLESKLLPSINQQFTSLITSLDVQDSEKHPTPNLELSLEILSNLDQTLESTISSARSFAMESPSPDGKHDHHLKKCKAFRLSQLGMNIQGLTHIRSRSVFQCCQEVLQWCGLSMAALDDPLTGQQASMSQRFIRILVTEGSNSIENTIRWSRKSDWAIITKIGWG
ncbi:hypothetical protein KEM48_002901 [Puccinia striiformis f. sp. tritici PST-130]|nr:hypothetical protein KEM48_002901 [Puccinia striiformis f. sp. tritici PST-130]